MPEAPKRLSTRKPLGQLPVNLATRNANAKSTKVEPRSKRTSGSLEPFSAPNFSSEDGLIRQHFDPIRSDVPAAASGSESATVLPEALSSTSTSASPETESHAHRSHFAELEDDDSDVDIAPNEVYDEDSDNTDYDGPQEPKWNKQIFNKLQTVMRTFSKAALDENDEDTYDVTMVAEYAPEIFNYLHELEHMYAADADYMANQDELRWEMRSVLIDWVVQVHQRFNLLPETLFLTVNYIDRFLSRRRVSLSRFQLVGAVALFIAAKYEEINCPTVQEVAYMADNAYSIEDFLKAERFMIDVLEFDMGWPGPMSFLRRTSKADDYDYETRTLAKYFLEITIMDHRFVASQPSWLAAGAHYLSRKMLNKGSWTDAHVFYSGYTEEQLKPLARIMMEMCSNAETHHKAIFEKYQERRYRRSSLFVQEFLKAMRSPKDE
ncbi:G2/mitotic-specific cyclin-4 [Candidozyma auris]|nr:G2/mitotic-specific cyclin-4 [[Candida] auris]PSK77719.1 G2/mitotic-specific cyclin-4 [[Candida] auris]QEL63063.1 G2/mitotic-specific cyclin-4 [[Candida] auris]GBL52495.1 putative cyclin [[Candida] auris]